MTNLSNTLTLFVFFSLSLFLNPLTLFEFSLSFFYPIFSFTLSFLSFTAYLPFPSPTRALPTSLPPLLLATPLCLEGLPLILALSDFPVPLIFLLILLPFLIQYLSLACYPFLLYFLLFILYITIFFSFFLSFSPSFLISRVIYVISSPFSPLLFSSSLPSYLLLFFLLFPAITTTNITSPPSLSPFFFPLPRFYFPVLQFFHFFLLFLSSTIITFPFSLPSSWTPHSTY